jgi:hypothetical protein
MSETPPTGAPVPDYNVPIKTKFTVAKLLAESDGSYSSFWPLLIFFCALLILFIYDVSYLRYRKLVLAEQLIQVVSREKGFHAQEIFIDHFHQDLEALAAKHQDVAVILNQYFPPESLPASATSPSSK